MVSHDLLTLNQGENHDEKDRIVRRICSIAVMC